MIKSIDISKYIPVCSQGHRCGGNAILTLMQNYNLDFSLMYYDMWTFDYVLEPTNFDFKYNITFYNCLNKFQSALMKKCNLHDSLVHIIKCIDIGIPIIIHISSNYLDFSRNEQGAMSTVIISGIDLQSNEFLCIYPPRLLINARTNINRVINNLELISGKEIFSDLMLYINKSLQSVDHFDLLYIKNGIRKMRFFIDYDIREAFNTVDLSCEIDCLNIGYKFREIYDTRRLYAAYLSTTSLFNVSDDFQQIVESWELIYKLAFKFAVSKNKNIINRVINAMNDVYKLECDVYKIIKNVVNLT